jgi:hypothetical protein
MLLIPAQAAAGKARSKAVESLSTISSIWRSSMM